MKAIPITLIFLLLEVSPSISLAHTAAALTVLKPTPVSTISIAATPISKRPFIPVSTHTTTVSLTPVEAGSAPSNTLSPSNIPGLLYLDAVYFNPELTSLGVHYKIASNGPAKISVFNMTGEEVAELLNGQKAPGSYSLSWNGRNQQNASVGGGVYMVVLKTPLGHTTQKVIVLK